MTCLEFLEKIIGHLAWPLVVAILFFILKHKILELFDRILNAKVAGIELGFAEKSARILKGGTDNLIRNDESQIIAQSEGANSYKLYANGVLVERGTATVLKGHSFLTLTYPCAFPHEPTSVEFIGIDRPIIKNLGVGNMELQFAPALEDRKFQYLISGI